MPWEYFCEHCGHHTPADPFSDDPYRMCKIASCHADGCTHCIGDDDRCRSCREANKTEED